MLFSEINPFVRYARYIETNKSSDYWAVIGLDARLFYTLDGYGKIKVENTEYEMRAYSLLLINSGIEYYIEPPEDSVNYIALNFDYTRKAMHRTIPIKPEPPPKFHPGLLIDPCDFEDARSLSRVLYIKELDGIQKKLAMIVNEYSQNLLYCELKCGHLLAECIADILRAYQIGYSHTESENSNQIISYIQKHYTENISNITLGKVFGYHPNYVNFLVKRMTGMSLHQYMIHLRLMNAVRLLENTEMSVGEIAIASGFCDTAYFSGYFKKHFGVSPSKYSMR